MRRALGALLFALANSQCSCSSSAQTFAIPAGSSQFAGTLSSAEPSPRPEPAPPGGPVAVYSNTTVVEALAGRGQVLWVATRGGLEQYDLTTRNRVAKYTTLAGLPTVTLEDVVLDVNGLPVVTTANHRCSLHAPTQRFACAGRTAATEAQLSPSSERIEGTPVTARYRAPDGREWLGTAGLGVWSREAGQLQRLTPTQQIVSNHVVATAEWKGSIYLASFDAGLGRLSQGQFSAVALQARLLNDVLATPNQLFVAASDGLYVSEDGEHFRRETRVTERFISDLAYDARRNILYATATNSLWELALDARAKPPRSHYLPGGSRSLQAVDVSPNGTVFLATEDRGVLRRDGKRKFSVFDRLAGYPSSWATDVLALDGESALFGSLHHGVFAVGSAVQQPPIASLGPWVLFLGRDSQDAGRVFIGTQGGATLSERGTHRNLPGLPNPCVHSIARLSSGLWVATEGGLAQYP